MNLPVITAAEQVIWTHYNFYLSNARHRTINNNVYFSLKARGSFTEWKGGSILINKQITSYLYNML